MGVNEVKRPFNFDPCTRHGFSSAVKPCVPELDVMNIKYGSISEVLFLAKRKTYMVMMVGVICLKQDYLSHKKVRSFVYFHRETMIAHDFRCAFDWSVSSWLTHVLSCVEHVKSHMELNHIRVRVHCVLNDSDLILCMLSCALQCKS